jgi:aquacobalamin reductase/NAD(P)H-flavin reductase
MITLDTSVVSIDSLTPYVLKVVLDAKQHISFKAGQYLQVVMGEKDKRPFSIANMPTSDGLIELHIGATPENPYAFEVVERAKSSGQLTVEIGLGDAFRRSSELPAILIAGGTGYSYTKSILFDCLREEPNREVHLYWGAKSSEDLYEATTLRALAETHQHFHFHPVVELPNDQWAGKSGLVHEAVLADFPRFEDKHVYVAGRFEMAGVIKSAYLPLGLDKNHLFGDAFAFI